MVESMRQISYPARSKGVATARMPNGAVASELAKDGKKKTIFRDLGTAHSLLNQDDRYFAGCSCHVDVSDLSPVFLLADPTPFLAHPR
jgi:hypothetical protein